MLISHRLPDLTCILFFMEFKCILIFNPTNEAILLLSYLVNVPFVLFTDISCSWLRIPSYISDFSFILDSVF